jgi:hypothetical protein
MNGVQHRADDPTASRCEIHVLLPEEKAGLPPKDSEEVMEQIRFRATTIGPVLEGILHDPHVLSHAEYDK